MPLYRSLLELQLARRIGQISRQKCWRVSVRLPSLHATARCFSCASIKFNDAANTRTIDAKASSTEPVSSPESSKDTPDTWQQHEDKLDPRILDSLKSIFKYEHMSPVQQAIVRKMPFKHDLLVRSQTGTGKTLGFLIPAVQKLFERDIELQKTLSRPALKEYGRTHASCLVISPTRELAQQIATETRRIVTYKESNYKALVTIGGDKLKDTLKLMARERCDFVVGTPGRILQMFRDEESFRELLSSVETVIFDEADTLLDFGFKQDLEEIVSYLPKDRQTFLFSATLSSEVKMIAQRFMKKYEYIDTVPKGGAGALQTITQQYMIVPLAQQLETTLDLINDALRQKRTAKIIIFLPTTTLAVLYKQAFSVLRQGYVAEHVQNFAIHSLLSQEKRSKVSLAFRRAAAGTILFSTDVSARGVDYPGVDLVIQVGAARDVDVYTHKTGRTGRAGKEGRSVLILDPIEEEFLKLLPRALTVSELKREELRALPEERMTGLLKEMRKFLDFGNILHNAFGPYANQLSARKRELRFSDEQFESTMTDWWSHLSSASMPSFPKRSSGMGRRSEQPGPRGSKRPFKPPVYSQNMFNKYPPPYAATRRTRRKERWSGRGQDRGHEQNDPAPVNHGRERGQNSPWSIGDRGSSKGRHSDRWGF